MHTFSVAGRLGSCKGVMWLAGRRACSDTDPDRAINEIQTCEDASHAVHVRHENAAKKNKATCILLGFKVTLWDSVKGDCWNYIYSNILNLYSVVSIFILIIINRSVPVHIKECSSSRIVAETVEMLNCMIILEDTVCGFLGFFWQV